MYDKGPKTAEILIQQEKIYQSIKDPTARQVIRTQIPARPLHYRLLSVPESGENADVVTLAEVVSQNPEEALKWIFGIMTVPQTPTQTINALGALSGISEYLLNSNIYPLSYRKETVAAINKAIIGFASERPKSSPLPLSDKGLSLKVKMLFEFEKWKKSNPEKDPSYYAYQIKDRYFGKFTEDDVARYSVEAMVSIFNDPKATIDLKAGLLYNFYVFAPSEMSDHERKKFFGENASFWTSCNGSWFYPELFNGKSSSIPDGDLEDLVGLRQRVAVLEQQLSGRSSNDSSNEALLRSTLESQQELLKQMAQSLESVITAAEERIKVFEDLGGNPLHILKINPSEWNNSSPDQRQKILRAAFVKTANKHHPDHGDQSNAELIVYKTEAFQRLNGANEYLKDHLKDQF